MAAMSSTSTRCTRFDLLPQNNKIMELSIKPPSLEEGEHGKGSADRAHRYHAF
jgi:hypothetical protein